MAASAKAMKKRDGSAAGRRKNKSIAKLDGITKAALWLLSVEEEMAVNTLGHMRPEEVQTLADKVRTIAKSSPEEIAAVHAEFNKRLGEPHMHLHGSMDYLGKIAAKAFGDDESARLLAEPEPEPEVPGAPEHPPNLKEADPDVLIPLLRNEHPQVVAAVIASLGLSLASDIIRKLPEAFQLEVVGRVAKLKRLPTEALERAEEVLATALPEAKTGAGPLDGVRVAASLVNQLDTDDAEMLLGNLAQSMGEVANEIRQAMFTFEDLSNLDRRGFQTLLKEVQSDQLLIALKTASGDLRDKVFSSLSKRAAEMLQDDLEVMGPVRLSDVEAAQQSIVSVALRLRSEGTLSIAGQGGDGFV